MTYIFESLNQNQISPVLLKMQWKISILSFFELHELVYLYLLQHFLDFTIQKKNNKASQAKLDDEHGV